MGNNMKKILFIASVVLNVTFAATYATYRLPLLAHTHKAPVPGGPLFLHLDLTAEQLSRFNAERDKFHARLQELGQQIKTKQIELIDLVGAVPPDQLAIERKQQEIQGLQAAVQDRVIIHFLQANSFLTPEQRARFSALIKARIGTSVQACPPWMRPVEQREPGAKRNE